MDKAARNYETMKRERAEAFLTGLADGLERGGTVPAGDKVIAQAIRVVMVAAKSRPAILSDEHRSILTGIIRMYKQPDGENHNPDQIDALNAALNQPPLTAAQRFADYACDISSGSGLDAADLQETLVEHGLLKPVEVTERCGEGCSCASYGDFPQTCYQRTTADVPGFSRDERDQYKLAALYQEIGDKDHE